MNKEQIIKRMNPIQLAKLNGPKTEVADTPTFNLESEVLTRPDYGGVPAEMEDIDLGITTDESGAIVSGKLVWMDFSKTPVEEVVDINYTNEGIAYDGNYRGPAMDTSTTIPMKLGPGLREQLKDEVFATQFNSPLDVPKPDGATVSLPRTKKKKRRR